MGVELEAHTTAKIEKVKDLALTLLITVCGWLRQETS